MTEKELEQIEAKATKLEYLMRLTTHGTTFAREQAVEQLVDWLEANDIHILLLTVVGEVRALRAAYGHMMSTLGSSIAKREQQEVVVTYPSINDKRRISAELAFGDKDYGYFLKIERVGEWVDEGDEWHRKVFMQDPDRVIEFVVLFHPGSDDIRRAFLRG